MMHRRKPVRILFFAALAIALAALFGFVVMHLWNGLVPELFGGKTVTYWQAIGLLVLSRILFGGPFRRGGHWGPGRFRMKERWERMTPEEREKFREGMRRGCRVPGAEPASEAR